MRAEKKNRALCTKTVSILVSIFKIKKKKIIDHLRVNNRQNQDFLMSLSGLLITI